MDNQPTILLIDDDKSLLRVTEYHLKEAGYNVTLCSDARDGLLKYRENSFDVILTDLRMPEMNGIAFIHAAREIDPNVVVVVITGHPTIDTAVEAMKAGAFDFIQKPVEKERLLAVTEKALAYANLFKENRRLQSLIEERSGFGNMIGSSPAIRKVYEQARQISASNVTILIQGATGTGKEMLARAIHVNSLRKDKKFIVVNCAAIPSSLIESELFGHTKGAFTGALSDRKGRIEDANGGTLFLDEVGDLPLDLQPKLLRVLQEREILPVGSNTVHKIDVRIITATHRDLKKMVAEGSFREDFFFRLHVVSLVLPPINERQEDILPLFNHFLKETAKEENKPLPVISMGVAKVLENYSWPGNVREIQNIAQRIMAFHSGKEFTLNELPEPLISNFKDGEFSSASPEGPFDLENFIDHIILKTLEKNNWNQSKTAKYLNISRNSLIYRMENRTLLKEEKAKRKQNE